MAPPHNTLAFKSLLPSCRDQYLVSTFYAPSSGHAFTVRASDTGGGLVGGTDGSYSSLSTEFPLANKQSLWVGTSTTETRESFCNMEPEHRKPPPPRITRVPTTCMTLSKLVNLSDLYFPHL